MLTSPTTSSYSCTPPRNRPRSSFLNLRASASPRESPLIHDEHAVFGHDFLGAYVQVRVADGIDADDVGLADLGQEITDHFVEAIVADFDAIGVANRLDADNFIGVFGHLERHQGLLDQALRW